MEKYESKFNGTSIPYAFAYWINPTGKILPLIDYADKFRDVKHIDAIIQNPKAFGLTIEQIQAMYDLEGEKLGIEGEARKKIIINLISQGWIRIRRYKKPDIWKINVDNFNNKVKVILYTFAKAMVEQHKFKYADVKIDSPDKVVQTSFIDIINDFKPDESMEGFKFIVCETVDDLL